MFIFAIRQENCDISYKFIDKSQLLVAPKDESISRTVWDGSLEKGVYVLVPSTTGCLFRKRRSQPTSDIHLTSMDQENDIKLNSEYQRAIQEIFHQLDLDESGSLSKAEFNLYNWRTSSLELTVSESCAQC